MSQLEMPDAEVCSVLLAAMQRIAQGCDDNRPSHLCSYGCARDPNDALLGRLCETILQLRFQRPGAGTELADVPLERSPWGATFVFREFGKDVVSSGGGGGVWIRAEILRAR